MSNFQSVSQGGIWVRRSTSVIPAATATVFNLNEVGLKSVHVYLSLSNETEGKYWTAHATIGRKNNTWRRVISHRLGDNIAKRIAVTSASSNLSLTIENLESFNININVAYLIIR